MNPKAATAPMDLAPDPVLASDALFVVGITSEGGVPLLVDSRRDHDVDRFVEGHEGAEGHEVVRLPGLSGSRPLDPLSTLHRRLQYETGLDAPELVVMSRYGIPTGARGRATILLAPHARVTAPASRNAALQVVPLPELSRWLSDCRAEGLRIDPRVWIGLLLAERHFPRWAEARLRAAVEELHHRRPVPAVEAHA